MGEFTAEFGDSSTEPINSRPALDWAETRESFRGILERHQGEELLDKLTEFHFLGVLEVVFVNDPHPDNIRRLQSEKIALARNLNPEL